MFLLTLRQFGLRPNCLSSFSILLKLQDLGAERIFAAERNNEKIAVEVKSFLGPSATTQFDAALGQFLKYQLALEDTEPDRLLYLAVPADTYRDFFSLELPRLLIQRYHVRLIVYDPEEEVITQWQQ
ncbi:MAG: fatty-acid oxidation protein subunit alpha [Cyanothece sp. SIO2G6]|nr:fatty-acid oxidation protein subunit alpha [Cyanothece sp. SIO2G6]